MKVRFWGTRGSLPAPLKSEHVEEKICQAILRLPDIDTKDEHAVRAYVQSLPPLLKGTAGGNTPCIEIESGDDTIILDAGSGLRELGIALMEGPCGQGKGVLHILISHVHWDHLHGFLIFNPVFVPGNKIFIYGVHDVEEAFKLQHQARYWPVTLDYMKASIEFVQLEAGQPFTIGNVHINTIENTHPGKSYSYRLESSHSSLVYASDAEFKRLAPEALQPHIDFFQNADAVIFDAQYALREAWTKVDWGHSSAWIGIDLARQANVDKLLLFHHDPTYTDAELENMLTTARAYQAHRHAQSPQEILIAYEGLTLDLVEPGVVDVQITADGETAIFTPIHAIGDEDVEQLAQRLTQVPGGDAPHSIIDLSQVETLTTANIKTLINLRQARKDEPIVLAAPSENIWQVIELAGYADYFAIYPSLETAISAVQAREALNLPGHLIKSRYQIESTVGKGPLGTVLTAVDTQTNKKVALKILSPTFSARTTEQFMRQTQQIVALDHPNVVKILTWGYDADYVFKVEEFVAAQTLESYLQHEATKRINFNLEIAVDIAKALDYAHRQGVIHGDLKPANVYLTDESVKVSGFGLGRLVENHNLLKAPYLFLSSNYLAPEQILGQPIDARTDLYALGIILYQLFTGQLPFTGSDNVILQAHLRQAPRPPREINPDITLSEEHLILKLLAKNPNDRYASAQQVLNIARSLIAYPEDTNRQRRIPLIGRAQPWEVLRGCWNKANAGHGQLVFITGEPGIGKSSLAQQVAAQSQPQVLLTGQCQEQQEAPAYQLFINVLRAYFATVPPEFFDEKNQQLLQNFARLIPEIRNMLPDLSPPPPLEPEQEQLRLMSSLTKFIKQATQGRTWLVILDNLQWADRNSLELLRYLGHHLPKMSLLMIGIYRDEEVIRGHPLRETLHHLNSYPGYTEIPLERLGQADVEQLLALIWRKPVPEALVERIYQHTEGNPRYVEEIAQSLIDESIIDPQQSLQHDLKLDQIRLPQSVHEAVWQRIGRLSPGTQTLLHQASVLGQSFKFDHLQEMSGLSKWETLEHLDTAMERQLIQEIPGDTTLRFRHNEIQQVLYTDLGNLRRRMLHRQAGEALERLAQPHPEKIAERLAYHFSQAEELGKALYYNLEAGRQAQAAYANESAVRWYRHVLDMVQATAPETKTEWQPYEIQAHQALGEVLSLTGHPNHALKHATAAWELLSTQVTAEYPLAREKGAQLARIGHRIAVIHEKRSEYDLAYTWVQKGLSYINPQQAAPETVHLYNLSGWLNIRQGNYEVALSQIQQALILAQAAHLSQAEANSLSYLGVAYSHLGKTTLAKNNYAQALHIYREIGDRHGESATLSHIGRIFQDQGNDTQAKDHYAQALSIYQEIGDRQGEGNVLNHLSSISRNENDYAQAVTYNEKALQIYRTSGDRLGESTVLTNIGIIFRSQGEYDRSRFFFEQAIRISREIGDRRGESRAIHNLGIVFDFLGAYAQAENSYQQALRLRLETGDRAGESETLAYMGLLAYHKGNYKLAKQTSQQAHDIAQNLNDRYKQARALTFLGHALVASKLLPQATVAYHKALNLHQALNQPHLALEAQAGLAHIALTQGNMPYARKQAQHIIAHLQNAHILDGTDTPFYIYQTCYRVIQMDEVNHPHASTPAHQILESAYRHLQKHIHRIKNESLRQSFIEVATHKAIIKKWESLHDE